MLSCTETKGPWIHLSLANKVKYSRVCSINLESAKKMKAVFNVTKENLDEGPQLPKNLEVFTESHAQKPQLQMRNFYSHPTKLKQSLFCRAWYPCMPTNYMLHSHKIAIWIVSIPHYTHFSRDKVFTKDPIVIQYFV